MSEHSPKVIQVAEEIIDLFLEHVIAQIEWTGNISELKHWIMGTGVNVTIADIIAKTGADLIPECLTQMESDGQEQCEGGDIRCRWCGCLLNVPRDCPVPEPHREDCSDYIENERGALLARLRKVEEK